jgi:hypothetical protein
VLGHTTPYKSGNPDGGKGLSELIDATRKASRLFANFATILMVEIINTNLPDGIEDAGDDVGDAPKMSDFHLPFFFDDEDLRAMARSRGDRKGNKQ